MGKEKGKSEERRMTVPGFWFPSEHTDVSALYWYFGYLENHKDIELAVLKLNHGRGILVECFPETDGLYIRVTWGVSEPEREREAEEICKQITGLIQRMHET